MLQGDVLDAMFVGIESETIGYSDAQARREGCQLRVALRTNSVEVTRADTDGYCGLGATFVGVYRWLS
jgi:hypothetical protein